MSMIVDRCERCQLPMLRGQRNVQRRFCSEHCRKGRTCWVVNGVREDYSPEQLDRLLAKIEREKKQKPSSFQLEPWRRLGE